MAKESVEYYINEIEKLLVLIENKLKFFLSKTKHLNQIETLLEKNNHLYQSYYHLGENLETEEIKKLYIGFKHLDDTLAVLRLEQKYPDYQYKEDTSRLKKYETYSSAGDLLINSFLVHRAERKCPICKTYTDVYGRCSCK